MKCWHIILILLLLTMRVEVKAQLGFDIPTIEAFIGEHRSTYSILAARSTLEMTNKSLHSLSKAANVEYKEINTELDKYERAFDFIDLLVNSVHLVFNAMDTYEVVSSKIVSYKKLIEEFNEKCLSRGNIYSTDTMIITINKAMIENVAKEGEKIYKSLGTIIGYGTGAMACTTASLMVSVNEINDAMDRIKEYLNIGYFNTWKYIKMRTLMWKPSVYQAKPLPEILDGAFENWINNTKKVANGN